MPLLPTPSRPHAGHICRSEKVRDFADARMVFEALGGKPKVDVLAFDLSEAERAHVRLLVAQDARQRLADQGGVVGGGGGGGDGGGGGGGGSVVVGGGSSGSGGGGGGSGCGPVSCDSPSTDPTTTTITGNPDAAAFMFYSTKFEKCCELLEQCRQETEIADDSIRKGCAKVLVFCMFTKALELLQSRIEVESRAKGTTMKVYMYTGQMTTEERDQMLIEVRHTVAYRIGATTQGSRQ
jgi:SNF2 family DNA or RNA helicase